MTPRGDQYNSDVNTVNKELRHHLSNSMIKRITHHEGMGLNFHNLNLSHLHNDRYQKLLRQTKKPPFRYQSQPRNDEKKNPNTYAENGYRSPHYQDTQQIKYWNTSPHNHRDTYPYWPKNNDHKPVLWQHSKNNEYALRSLVSMV